MANPIPPKKGGKFVPPAKGKGKPAAKTAKPAAKKGMPPKGLPPKGKGGK